MNHAGLGPLFNLDRIAGGDLIRHRVSLDLGRLAARSHARRLGRGRTRRLLHDVRELVRE
jgi:hypothetical protein